MGKFRRGTAILFAVLASKLDKSREWKFVEKRADLERSKPKDKFDTAKFYRSLAALGTETVNQFRKEFPKMAYGPGKLRLEEYARYQLYRTDGITFEEKKQFISDKLMWRMVNEVNDATYFAITEDKFLSYNLLTSFGFAVPKTVAVVTTGTRSFPNVVRIETPEELHAFLASQNQKLFFKSNTGLGSFGAFVFDGITDGAIIARPHGKMTAAGLMSSMDGFDFLAQEFVQVHSDLAAMTSAVPTVRLTNFLVDGRVHCPVALLKIPAQDSVADNYWRTGNMLANLDPETGTILRVIRGDGFEMEHLESHPDTHIPLIGFQVPFWREILETNRTCALAFAPLPFSSLDITAGPEGPVIVEVNGGGSFDLPQLASGHGLLTPEVKEFFGI